MRLTDEILFEVEDGGIAVVTIDRPQARNAINSGVIEGLRQAWQRFAQDDTLRVVIAAHGNSIRALIKYLDGISDDAIVGVNVPNGLPLVYELDAQLKPIRSYYLGDAEAAAQAAAAVANQGKAQ